MFFCFHPSVASGSGGEGCEPALGGQRGQPSCATLWEMAAMR